MLGGLSFSIASGGVRNKTCIQDFFGDHSRSLPQTIADGQAGLVGRREIVKVRPNRAM